MADRSTVRSLPRRGAARLTSLAIVAALVVAACGGPAAGAGGGGDGGGGGSDPAYDGVIQQTQAAFGTSMIAGSAEGGTLKITLIDGANDAMARLFLCSNIEGFLKAAGLGASKVVITSQSGQQLATEADCKH